MPNEHQARALRTSASKAIGAYQKLQRSVRFEIGRLEQRTMLSAVDPSMIPPEASIVHPIALPRYSADAIHTLNGRPTAVGSTTPQGYTPAQMRGAYGIDATTFGNVIGDGTGQTIAIVDAYDLPNAFTDLQAFDATFGLPDPPSFTKLNQFGQANPLPTTDPAGAGNPSGTWEVEESLDIQWAHVIAPHASLVLVEANDSFTFNLLNAVNAARRLTASMWYP